MPGRFATELLAMMQHLTSVTLGIINLDVNLMVKKVFIKYSYNFL